MPKTTTPQALYPECEKIAQNREKSQVIGEFLEWLQEKNVELAMYSGGGERLYLWNYSTEKLLADFFGIDLNKAEKERQEMLSNLRK